MRILLINPPRSPHNAILDHAPADAKHLIHRKLVGPPMGLLCLGAAARDHDVTLLELKGEYDLHPDAAPMEQLLEQALRETRPHLAGVTFIASEFPAGMDLLRTVRRFDPTILTVAGGLHATLCPEHFDDPAVDLLYRSASAVPFRDLLRALEGGEPLQGIRGLFRRRPEGGFTPDAWRAPLPPEPFDYIPPDRSLLARWKSTYRVHKDAGLATYVNTTLGCPHRCTFCSIWPQFGGRSHHRDVDDLVEEIAALDDDYEVVRFADANTVIEVEFVQRLFDRIEERGIRKAYVMDIRADTAAEHPRLIERMARAGLKVVITGFESFRAAELQRYNKQLRADRIAEALRVYHDNGIMVRGNYVIPPDYTEPDFDALGEFASRHPTALAGYTILSPMPGTAYHDEVQVDIVDRDLAKYNFFNSVLRTRLPLERFYELVGGLWKIRSGTEVI